MSRFLTLACCYLRAVSLLVAAEPDDVIQFHGLEVKLEGVSKEMRAEAEIIVTKQLKLSDDTKLSAPLADDLAFFLQRQYAQSGYDQAQVEWDLQDPQMILQVTENARMMVGQISITGVDESLLETLQRDALRPTREREKRSESSTKPLPFVESELKAGAELMQRRLQAAGYLDATVAEPVFTRDAAQAKVDLLLAAIPGRKYVFGTIRIAGAEEAPDEAAQKLEASLLALKDQPYNEVSLETLRKQIKADYEARGYFGAEVTATADRAQASTGVVPAVVQVTPGEVFKVASVTVSDSLGRGASRVATAVMQPALGQAYAPLSQDLLLRRALATGIYSRLDVQPEISGPGEMTLHLSGAEARPRTLGIFGGFETFSGPILGVETRHVNFGNTGDLLAAKADFTARGLHGDLQWLDPAIFDSRNSLGLDLSATTFSFKAYDRRTLAFKATLSRRFSQGISAEVFSSYALSNVKSVELSSAELGPQDYGTADLGARVTFDFRDVPLSPHRGWLFNGSIDAVGADVQFARLDTSIAYYHPLAEHWRFALGAKSSALYGSGELAEVPIDLRLFNGGANSVRSFPEREIGSISAVGDTPLGGLASHVVSAELSYEIISNLEIAGFADAGGLNQKDASLFKMDDWKYAVGLGVRYNLPIGPLRIDYGFNPQRAARDPSGTLHVTFGFAF